MTKTYVLDANAILGFTDDSTGADRVQQLLVEARKSKVRLLVSVANWGEVFYHSWQMFGEEEARRILGNLSRLSMEIVPVDEQQALKAAEIKARHRIPYVDCMAAALAITQQAVLVTSDRDFEKLGRHARILWLDRN